MALEFTVVATTRHQLGSSDENIGTYVGLRHDFTFDCPGRDASEHAILLFQSYSVGAQQKLLVNGTSVWGGVPQTTGSFSASTSTSEPEPSFEHPHTHSLPGGDQTGASGGGFDYHRHGLTVLSSLGWTGNVLLIEPGTLRESNNVLRVESTGDNFVIDNLAVLYKVEQRGLGNWWRARQR